MYQEIRLGDIVKMRKPHPCGGFEWEVVRLGADIGIRCGRCGRRVLIPRSQFLRQVKTLLQPGPDSPEGASPSSRETPMT
jgi:hypothetical protein